MCLPDMSQGNIQVFVQTYHSWVDDSKYGICYKEVRDDGVYVTTTLYQCIPTYQQGRYVFGRIVRHYYRCKIWYC
jgi:hypothetical protein